MTYVAFYMLRPAAARTELKKGHLPLIGLRSTVPGFGEIRDGGAVRQREIRQPARRLFPDRFEDACASGARFLGLADHADEHRLQPIDGRLSVPPLMREARGIEGTRIEVRVLEQLRSGRYQQSNRQLHGRHVLN